MTCVSLQSERFLTIYIGTQSRHFRTEQNGNNTTRACRMAFVCHRTPPPFHTTLLRTRRKPVTVIHSSYAILPFAVGWQENYLNACRRADEHRIRIVVFGLFFRERFSATSCESYQLSSCQHINNSVAFPFPGPTNARVLRAYYHTVVFHRCDSTLHLWHPPRDTHVLKRNINSNYGFGTA